MIEDSEKQILKRIQSALESARSVLTRFTAGAIEAEYKAGHDPVTEADKSVDAVLHKELLRDGEGWLSEESVDDLSRLNKTRVWVVDPLDGTREFVAGIPEFCVSVAFVQNGQAVAGGICNPATNEIFLGSHSGVTYNGTPARPTQRADVKDARILASRSEVERGEWEQFADAPFEIRPMGSVAYKLALVSAGLADATFTLVPKHEWDIAAGVALVQSAGGFVSTLENTSFRFNQKQPLVSGLIAGGCLLKEPLLSFLEPHLNSRSVGKISSNLNVQQAHE
jgi:myo-inositol-1(or 4)-monophosphatase